MNIPDSTMRLAAGAGVLAPATGILAPAGPVGRHELTILLDSLAVMLAIVIPTIAAIFIFAWRYRASNTKARYLPDWSYSGRLELVTWSIPSLIVLFLSGLIWTGSHGIDPAHRLAASGTPLEVQVVSLDWKWLFIYPEQHLALVNELVIPAGRPVHLSLTSGSVMNSFFVPRLGGMIAVMNGMVTQLHLQADEVGEYAGFSTQFSGDGFADMHFATRVLTAGDFDTWSRATAGTSNSILERTSFMELQKQSRNVRPEAWRLGDPDLFHSIVRRQIPAGPGPPEGPTAVRPQ
jgi:cytochrome o ubiquinol oxidase subunit II